jgi:selenoprotein W-related protein
MDSKPRVEIEYCRRSGYMLRAAWMAQELLKSFEAELGEVALRPSGDGHFIVRVNGALVFSNQEAGRYPEAKELRELVRNAIRMVEETNHFGRDETV